MTDKAVVVRDNKELARIRERLTPEQIIYAEWLSYPVSEREPKTQKELAERFGVTERALTNWKKIPEIWELRDSHITNYAKDLVPAAINTIKEAMKSKDSKVALAAAKDILDRWSEPKKHTSIIATIQDLYNKYNKESK